MDNLNIDLDKKIDLSDYIILPTTGTANLTHSTSSFTDLGIRDYNSRDIMLNIDNQNISVKELLNRLNKAELLINYLINELNLKPNYDDLDSTFLE